MPEVNQLCYEQWPRPMTEEQLGQAATIATIQFAGGHERFKVSELLSELDSQYLTPVDSNFAQHFKKVIMPQAIELIEGLDGVGEWQHKPRSSYYELNYALPDEPEVTVATPSQLPAENPIEDPEDNSPPDILKGLDAEMRQLVDISSLVLDGLTNFTHPHQYLVTKIFYSVIREKLPEGTDFGQFKKVITHLCSRGILDQFHGHVRKHGRYIGIRWADFNNKRAWQFAQDHMLQHIIAPVDEPYVAPPLTRKSRKAARKEDKKRQIRTTS